MDYNSRHFLILSFYSSRNINPNIFLQDEVFDGGLVTTVPKSTLYDTLHTMRADFYTAVFESFQAQLKTRQYVMVYLWIILLLQTAMPD